MEEESGKGEKGANWRNKRDNHISQAQVIFSFAAVVPAVIDRLV